MSASLGQSSGSPWRKRPHQDLTIDIKELKRPRHYYYRLESESSKASDDETESVCSVQDKETDFVKDTTDTESQDSDHNRDEYDLEFEYEVASLSENDGIEVSTTDSEGMMLAAAAAVICDSSIEAWVTDVEDSDSSSEETSFGRTDFSTCVQCKGENCNPLYRYCEKCFQGVYTRLAWKKNAFFGWEKSCRQCNKRKTVKCFPLCQSCYKDRKKFFPPRPRRNRRRRQQATKPVEKEDPVKLDTLRNCLSGLSQDSGIGSSQDCPSLGLDQIVVPEHLQQSSGTSKSEDISPTLSKSLVTSTREETAESDSKKSIAVNATAKELALKRKRTCSESSLSDCDVKKPKLAISKSEHHPTSDLGSEVSSSCSLASTSASFSSETSGFQSERSSGSLTLQKSGSFGSEKSESELCMFCNSAPKDSIFLHANIAHRCCCYPCAKKTLKSIKRCPICNRSVNKVVKIFTS